MSHKDPVQRNLASYSVLRFQRSGIDAQKLVKAFRQVTKDEQEIATLIDAVLVYTKGLQQLRSKKGPFDMHSGATKRPQPFKRIGGTKFMLPKLPKW